MSLLDAKMIFLKNFFCPYIDVDIMRQERFEGRNVGWRSEGVAIATVAEWLRRLTRNQIPFGSAGSNPAGCETYSFCGGMD